MSVDFSSNAPSEPGDLNLSNSNARALLGALRLSSELVGQCTIFEARRAIIRARSGSLAGFTRPSFVEYGAPVRVNDQLVNLRPVRVQSTGLDEDGLRARLDRFAVFVERAAARGATDIFWS